MAHPKVFISYSHDTEAFGDKVLDFSNMLRREYGIDAEIDQYEENPAQGWPMWMDEQIRDAEFVLVICTKSYFDKVYHVASGKGVTWEIQSIYQHLYASNANNQKFIPVMFKDADSEYIPMPLKPYTYYNVGDTKGLKKLVNRLHGIKNVEKPDVGEYKALPEKERKQVFFSSPIRLELWDKAGWKGAAFVFCEDESVPPIIGLCYQNIAAGKTIFEKWKEEYAEKLDDYLQITIVEPPFSLLTHSSGAYAANGEGYFMLIQPNTDGTIKHIHQSGVNPGNAIIMTIQRWLFIDAVPGDWKRKEFKRRFAEHKKCLILPCGFTTSNGNAASSLIPEFDYALEFRSIRFVEGTSITPDELESVIYHEIK